MSSFDIIPLPGHPGMFARRVIVNAWQQAGSPKVNSAGRLYGKQKYYWDGWRKRLPGFQPADNPDDERQRLAHLRFVALDIDPTPERVRRLSAAGLIRPYSYEPWHWEVPNVYAYPIVRTIPASAHITPIEAERDEPMYKLIKANNSDTVTMVGLGWQHVAGSDWEATKWLWGDVHEMSPEDYAAQISRAEERAMGVVQAFIKHLPEAQGIDYEKLAAAIAPKLNTGGPHPGVDAAEIARAVRAEIIKD